jgi:hypothetical protein
MNGTATLGRFAHDQGCKVKYCFDPGHGAIQGHMWILAQKSPPGWMADRLEDLMKLIPQLRV